VYKVDRLTRSLADFAKMVEIFDVAGVSFVAVTQQFDTATSMGLTLNVLLSFAQFEREVTGEVQYSFQLIRSNTPIPEDEFERWDDNQSRNYSVSLA
jgi:hypothetical protein